MTLPLDQQITTEACAIAPKCFSVQSRPYNPLQVRPRRVQFHFSAEIPRLWLQKSLVKTHFLNAINLFVGEFEAFSVRNLRSHLPSLQDPILHRQIVGFMGQEIIHAHVHEAYNQTLRKQGYRFDLYLRFIRFFFRKILERCGVTLGLAIIAGFEHATAALAEAALQSKLLTQAHPTLKSMWEWHAAEELEHQTLVFQCLHLCNSNYGLRCLGGLLGLAIVLGFSLSGMVVLMVQEPGWIRWKTVSDAVDLLITGDRLLPHCFQRFLPYFNPDFHPTASETSHLGKQILG